MDTKATPLNHIEIEQFLVDVRAHFRASLETSEYENTSNIFHVTAAEQTIKLLSRCELLLAQYADEQAVSTATAVIKSNGIGDYVDSKISATNGSANKDETGCYLEMLPASVSKNSLSASREYVDFASNTSVDSDKTFRCSSKQPTTVNSEADKDQQLYDICQSLVEDEAQKVMAPDLNFTNAMDCPYADLPAGHLAIQRSTKYGQLQRIEKRLFFDQSKKCYCGILNDWMLCYVDGPTSCRPTSTLYLKSSAIEIEHFGEGKRRDICFQITTADPNKKFIYQANNEVDAKEWIHAIEAAIRGDAAAATTKSPRKLPTPPLMKKANYIACNVNQQHDSIYEEPSPIYDCSELVSPPRLPEKCNSPNALAKRFEYDIPKSPPQPLDGEPDTPTNEAAGLLNGAAGAAAPVIDAKPQPSSLHNNIKLDFQTKVKTVHSELSSQLSPSGPSPEQLQKAVKKTYSCGSSEGEMMSLTSLPSLTTQKEQKKQRRSQTPQSSPQKTQSKDCDKLARSWFLSRLNKSTGLGTRNSTNSNNSSNSPGNAKGKHSEKENLLNGQDVCENFEGAFSELQLNGNSNSNSSNPTSPCLKTDAKGKVNMIINQFESSGHLSAMFSVEALAANALASLTSFCEGDTCNNYEPIMPVSTPPSSFLKKV